MSVKVQVGAFNKENTLGGVFSRQCEKFANVRWQLCSTYYLYQDTISGRKSFPPLPSLYSACKKRKLKDPINIEIIKVFSVRLMIIVQSIAFEDCSKKESKPWRDGWNFFCMFAIHKYKFYLEHYFSFKFFIGSDKFDIFCTLEWQFFICFSYCKYCIFFNLFWPLNRV